jgi:hypothetical protein
VPFFAPSVQVAARHTKAVHTLLAQSLGPAHALPATHLAQLAPPQSMSVSVPFFTLSVHLGIWQILPMHTPSRQSAATEHILPFAHFGQLEPPQSMSVSVPFFTLSVHAGVWHVPGDPVQMPLWQSDATTQNASVAHLGQAPPPQSTSVSVPFLTVSVHAGG